MSEKKVLFVVEGAREGPRFIRNLIERSYGIKPQNIISYGTNIYDLLERVYDDGDVDQYVDLISLLSEDATETG